MKNYKCQTITNFQIPKSKHGLALEGFGYCVLEFIWDLVFVICDFGHSQSGTVYICS